MNKFVDVYRIETVSGCGPYRGPDSLFLNEQWNSFYDYDLHPSPWIDEKLRDHSNLWDEKENYIFGFKSIEQLYQWFYSDKILMLMKHHGFLIIHYVVDEKYVVFGEKQLIFKKLKSKIIDRKKIYTLRYRKMGYGK